jgi:hypothetical protein
MKLIFQFLRNSAIERKIVFKPLPPLFGKWPQSKVASVSDAQDFSDRNGKNKQNNQRKNDVHAAILLLLFPR